MKKNLLFFLSIIIINIYAQNDLLIGYLPTYRFKVSNNINFEKLTHVNICFANINSKGEVIKIDSLKDIITVIRKQNPQIKINLSLAGGALSKDEAYLWKKYVDNTTYRKILVRNILKYIEEYGFDGIDVDLEWKNVTTGYSSFILDLKKSKPKHISLTAALPGILRYKNITDEALAAFDYINIMAYDERGSWAPQNAGQHSSFNFAKRSVEFWKNENVPPQKLILGLPFYAYNFTNSRATKPMMFREVLALDSLNLYRDNYGLIYYNGIRTLKQKVEYALNEIAGVMVWELGQDSTNEYSLLFAIQEKFYEGTPNVSIKNFDSSVKNTSKELLNNISLSISDDDKFLLLKHESIKSVKISILDSNNKKKKLRSFNKKGDQYIKIKRLKRGDYIIIMQQNDEILKKKLSIK